MPQITARFSHSQKLFHIPGAAAYYGIKPFAPATVYLSVADARKAAENRTEAVIKQDKRYFGSKVLAGFSAAESECSPFSSEAAARAFFGKSERKPKPAEGETPEQRMEEARKKVRALFGHEDV